MKIEQDEDFMKKEKKPRNKVMTIISVLIVITVLIVIAIIILMMQVEKNKLSVTVDGKKVTINEDTFLFAENSGEVYVSIQDIAPLVGYEAHNGEYKVNAEDTSKMYVEAIDGTETTSFYLNSRLINKVPPESDADYESVQMGAPVVETNGRLYVSAEGFSQGFNSVFHYDKTLNTIVIQTLPYLVEYYRDNIANYGYDELSEEFNNQKALVYGLIVASKETTGNFGVINATTNREVISPRYKNIQFIEGAEEFIITNSSDKVGIAYASGETKINVQYDNIKMLDSKRGYYLVQSLSKYGVINSSEELVIHIEYDKIGIDTSEFPSDRIANQYILYDTIIPVCLNEKWGLFNINGEKIAEPEYDTIGCINDNLTDKVVNNALTIGNSKVIVVSKDGVYGGISTKGDLLLPLMFQYIYSLTSGGQTTYYMVRNDKTYYAMELITLMKEKLGGYEEEQTSTPSPSPSPEVTDNATPTPENSDNQSEVEENNTTTSENQ
ncbi:MAG: hypothetical protein HFJ51_01975 [Clostridia bacterium]|nr:hypothetical protein [Clostridia bacterium]